MLSLRFGPSDGRALEVLCLGAHCDDIEIGCGGTVLRLVEAFPNSSFHWVVLSCNDVREAEARASAEEFLADARRKDVLVERFRESYFPWVAIEIKEFFEGLKERVSPDLVLTHCRGDLHQDHRLVCELTWNTFRDHAILEYEIPKYDGDLGSPNFFVPLPRATAERKVEALLRHFESQLSRPWFDADTFWSLLRLRGLESNADEHLAEGFYARKLVMR